MVENTNGRGGGNGDFAATTVSPCRSSSRGGRAHFCDVDMCDGCADFLLGLAVYRVTYVEVGRGVLDPRT